MKEVFSEIVISGLLIYMWQKGGEKEIGVICRKSSVSGKPLPVGG
jgi:hypothetical protein